MSIVVRRPGCSTQHELDLDADTTVRQLKELLPNSFRQASADAVHLIYGGNVLLDSARLSELALEETATLWLILGRPVPSSAEAKPLLEAAGFHGRR